MQINVRQILVNLLLAVAIIATAILANFAISATQTLTRLESTLHNLDRSVAQVPVVLDHSAQLAVSAARLESAAWRKTTDKRLLSAQSALVSESAAYRDMFRAEIAVTRTDAMGEIRVLGGDISKTLSRASNTLDAYAVVPSQVSLNLAPWTDCRGNGACVQAQFTALLGASRSTAGETSRTMRAVREATPQLLLNVDRTTENVAKLTRPESLAMRTIKMLAPLLGGTLFGLIK
jgi:hypothetical protein